MLVRIRKQVNTNHWATGARIEHHASLPANSSVSCKELEKVEPAIAVPMIQDAVRAAATALHLQTTDLPSAAVQDAQQIARIAPMGMIFVPSKDGVSHSPKEYTSWSDVRNGAEVLYRTLITLDREVK